MNCELLLDNDLYASNQHGCEEAIFSIGIARQRDELWERYKILSMYHNEFGLVVKFKDEHDLLMFRLRFSI